MTISKRRKLLLSLTILGTAAVFCVAFRRAYVASASRLVDVRATPTRNAVRIDGRIFDSGMRITRSTTQRLGDTLLVRIYITPVNDTDAESVRRGDFHLNVSIPEGVQTVAIGESPRFATVGHLFGAPIRVPRILKDSAARPVWTNRNGA
jgi:hypothetical protein